MAATQRMAPLEDVELVYVTYHVDVGETPFMVGVDHHRQTVIVCIRGTMSTKVRCRDGLCVRMETAVRGSELFCVQVLRMSWVAVTRSVGRHDSCVFVHVLPPQMGQRSDDVVVCSRTW